MGVQSDPARLAVARSIVDALPDAAILLDAELAIVAHNARYQELTGLRHRALETRIADAATGFDALLGLTDLSDRDSARACLARRRPIHLADVTVRSAAGHEMTAYVSFLPVLDDAGDAVGVVEILRDVSDEARVQARYRELLEMARLRAENLEREVDRRTQELSAALEEVTRLSREDPLTGLLNRRSFTEMAERTLMLAARHGRNVGLLLCDLDHFKRINDTSGHQTGDAVLVAASRSLQASVRGTDLVGRFGGEEFIVLLSETEPETVFTTAERCRVAVSSAAPVKPGQTMPTVSIGAAIFPQHGRTLDELVMNADGALYRAKHGGRDNVVMYDPTVSAAINPELVTGSRLRVLLVSPGPEALAAGRLSADLDVTIEPDVAAAVARCNETAYDVVIADHPSHDVGIDLLRAVLRARPEALRVMVLESEDAYAEVRGTTLARVDCFILRSEGPDQVADAVRHALGRREIGRQRLFMVNEDVRRLFSSRLIELDRLIDGGAIRFAYQPIVDARTGAVRAYEALARADHPVFGNATILFEAALQSGNLWRLGRVCRRRAVERLSGMTAGTKLFINLHPAELDDPHLLAGELERAACERVVLEITERASIPDFRRFRATTQALAGCGYQLAIDDLGAGYASLSAVALLEPSFVKLDMSIVRGIERSRHKSQLVRRMVDFANDVGIELVAEGVETEDEARVVADLGCHLAQGYFFGAPA